MEQEKIAKEIENIDRTIKMINREKGIEIRSKYLEIIDLYLNKNMNRDDIGKIYGCSKNTIFRILKENNVSKYDLLRKDFKEMIKLYSEGKSAKEIGKFFGCSSNTIYRILKDNNISKINPLKENYQKIIKMYTEDFMSAEKIGKLYNRSCPTILKILKENGVKIGGKERFKLLYQKGKMVNQNKRTDLCDNKDKIIRMYVDENKTCKEIGEIFNTHLTTICNFLNKNGIDTSTKGRLKSEITKKRISLGKLKGIEEGRIIAKSGENHPFYHKTYEEIYGVEKAEEIKEKNSKFMTKRNLKNNPMSNIETRKKVSAKRQGISLDNWNGFIGKGEYDERWTPQFRNSIRNRDNQVCMNCGVHREKLKRALSVHHINSDKKMSIQENCVSLCDSCHNLTFTNREYWQKLFQEKLSKLYNYQYSEDGKIILNLNKQIGE